MAGVFMTGHVAHAPWLSEATVRKMAMGGECNQEDVIPSKGAHVSTVAWVSDSVARDHGAALARLFSTSVIRELASKGCSPLAAQVLKETGVDTSLAPSVSLAECFDSLLQSLSRNYRNEYVYKNAIANKILLGRHSLNSSFMLTEFRVLDSKADVVVLNGSSHVYEIKSEFDSIARLQKQVDAYQTAFDYVNVITSADQQQAILGKVDESVGLMVLTDRDRISTIREARSCKARVDPSVVFDSLRKVEYEQIISERFGFVPDVPNTQIYRACRKLFCRLGPEEAHDAMVRILRRRGDCLSLRSFIECVPPSLKALSLACTLTWQERSLFLDLLQTSARKALLVT